MEQFLAEDISDFTSYKYMVWARKYSRPVSATWEITNACNLSCKYCGLDSGRPLEDELSIEEACELIDNISEAGTASLMILGGEPTVRRDLPYIVEYASLFMSTGINTNGILLDKDYARRLEGAGLHEVKVSIDGPQTHDLTRGEGSYGKALAAIGACKDAGISSVVIETTVSQLNYGELPDIVELASELDTALVVNEFIPFGRAQGMPGLALSREQRKGMQRYLLDLQKQGGKISFENRYIISEDRDLMEMCVSPLSREANVGCCAGIFAYGIRPNGKVLPCPCLRIEVGDLRNERLSEIWVNSDVLRILRNRDLGGKCGRCEYRFICGGCRGRTYVATGDFMAEDPWCWYEPQLRG